MSSLDQANALMREGKCREALEQFSELLRLRPGFTPYQQGYLLALKRLGEALPAPAFAADASQSEAVHPESRSMQQDSGRVFVVVTAVLDGGRFLKECLSSVLGQEGDFFIDYFVKDGGSSDETLAILEDYSARIRAGKLPLRCRGIRLQVQTGPDLGLYDAVADGFAKNPKRARPDDILTYINADDVFADGAFQIAMEVFAATPARWICGQINVINERGEVVVRPEFPISYARADIRAGLHDGRALNFIQQEGSFWLRELYDAVGGVNRSLRFAGDFDLWWRFSGMTELLALDQPLASFRSRRGQLSEQMDKYYREVDALCAVGDLGATQEDTSDHGQLQFMLGDKAPAMGFQQRPGPVCFLRNGRVTEIAYIKRGWLSW